MGSRRNANELERGSIRIEVRGWSRADIRVGGETIFAVGDVHGCAALLQALLGAFSDLATGTRRRLVSLGDIVNRGPESIRALDLWSADMLIPGLTRVNRLMGNHEQLLLIAMGGGRSAARAHGAVLGCGGDRLLAELRAATGSADAPLRRDLLETALTERTWRMLLTGLESHVRIGNALFVHAGVDPTVPLGEFLSLPADTWPDDGRHWAWIEAPFPRWRGRFAGTIVIHGHVPPHKYRFLTGERDCHVLRDDRLGLDGGSATTGVVVGAQIEDGRYRVIRAIADVSVNGG